MTINFRPGSKRATCFGLISRRNGVTLTEGVELTTWSEPAVLSEFYILAKMAERKLVKNVAKKSGRVSYRLA